VTSPPLVTVLMAVHDGGDFVRQAVESVLRQTFADFELLIVDDGSTDETPRLLASFDDARIRIVRNDENLGLTRSLNRGLAMARGALIARQDADDLSHAGRLAAQVAFLDREPGVAVLGTQARYVNVRGRSKSVAPWPKSTSNLAIRWQLLFDGPFVHASVMFRKAVVWDALGGYDESFRTSQDFELWSRINARGYGMRNLPDALVDFRVHEGSMSRRYASGAIDRVAAVVKRNLVLELGPGALPEGWPDAWMRLTNPQVYPNTGDDWQTVVRAIGGIFRAFVLEHPDAAHDEEIRRHLASMLIRLSHWGAARGRMASIASFARACRLDPPMAARAAPRYVGHWMLRGWRGAGAVPPSPGA
jgi:Glycosyl transferase family 2